MVRIDVNNPLDLTGRMPSGKEMCANDKYIPGEYTDGPYGGSPEIVTNKIPNDDTHRTITFGI